MQLASADLFTWIRPANETDELSLGVAVWHHGGSLPADVVVFFCPVDVPQHDRPRHTKPLLRFVSNRVFIGANRRGFDWHSSSVGSSALFEVRRKIVYCSKNIQDSSDSSGVEPAELARDRPALRLVGSDIPKKVSKHLLIFGGEIKVFGGPAISDFISDMGGEGQIDAFAKTEKGQILALSLNPIRSLEDEEGKTPFESQEIVYVDFSKAKIVKSSDFLRELSIMSGRG
jgi:hypothetical protein